MQGIVPFSQVPNHPKTLRILCFFQPEGSQLFDQLIHKRTILNPYSTDLHVLSTVYPRCFQMNCILRRKNVVTQEIELTEETEAGYG